jgi:hypothetical protein
MLTGHGLLSFKVVDGSGTVIFMQLNDDGDYARIVAQFAPEEEVSKRRVALALSQVAIPVLKGYAEGYEKKGLVFESINDELTGFMNKLGFYKADGTNDYRWAVEGTTDV